MSRLAIGLGCRKGCPAEAVLAVVRDACARLDLTHGRLFSIEAKRHETGLHEAAAELGLPLVFLPESGLAVAAEHVSHRSPRVAAAMGVPSVAEAAALAGAGAGSRLLIPRRAHAAATCAVAVAAGDEP